MFFKKKISVEDYCTGNLQTVFSKERDAVWETLRLVSSDGALNAIDVELYYKHLRAVFVQLMLIGIAKNCSMDASSNAHVFVMVYLKERSLSEIQDISRGYNQAFASSMTDGVRAMAVHFGDALTGGKIQQQTIDQLDVEFYAILRIFLDDFKRLKLVPSR